MKPSSLLVAWALALAVAPAAPALAQDLAAEDRAAIEARIAQFDAAMAEADFGGLYAYLPPAIRAHMAEQLGVPEGELDALIRSSVGDLFADVTVSEFGMDLDAATFQDTPDGARTYGLIPTVTVMSSPDIGSVRTTAQTVALEDEGQWYLVRVDDPSQAETLQAAYPEFAGATFEPATVEAVE